MDDKDVHSEMKRVDMENLCANIFQRVEATLQQCLVQCSKSVPRLKVNLFVYEIVVVS